MVESANQSDRQGEHLYFLSQWLAPVGGEGGGVGALPLPNAWEDGAEEPVSEVPPALSVWSHSPPPFAASLRSVCYAIR